MILDLICLQQLSSKQLIETFPLRMIRDSNIQHMQEKEYSSVHDDKQFTAIFLPSGRRLDVC